MSQSLSFLLVHLVFSTKDRRPLLNESVRSGLHAYLATVAREKKCDCFRVGGVADHVHLAVRLHATKSVAKLVEELKTSSSRWLKVQGVEGFAWQRGYGAFSVNPADSSALVRYIEEQDAHHRKRDFQQEMRAFFEKYHVAFDERYVWD
jgi:REP element-mobilizing transposase RayT